LKIWPLENIRTNKFFSNLHLLALVLKPMDSIRDIALNRQTCKTHVANYRVGQKKWPNLFLSELCQISTKYFWQTDSQDDKIMRGTFILHLTQFVNALPCKMQMLQIVTLCGDYQYQIVHLFIINSTEGATWFNNFVGLNILHWKQQTTK